jgi:alpha-L-rhamnosidase
MAWICLILIKPGDKYMLQDMGITAMNGTKWIGIASGEARLDQGNTLVYFRKAFPIEKLGRMEICITANNRYKLWVNGQRVCSGPCKGDRWRQFYDVVNISPYLGVGENVIAVEVLYFAPALYGDGNKTGPANVVTNALGPMLAVKGELQDENGKILECITTGSANWYYKRDEAVSWKVFTDDYIPVGAFEQVKGEKIPAAWKIDTSPVQDWKKAVVRYDTDGSAWGNISPLPLLERSIPLLYEKECSLPGKETVIAAHSRREFVYDAGELTTGYFKLKVSGGKGSRVKITYAESYSGKKDIGSRKKGVRDDSVQFELHGANDLYWPAGKAECYEPFGWRTFRFVKIGVETAEDPLQLHVPEYVETGYPLEAKSSFRSDAKWTKYLWETSIRTLQRCMHETYEDCPYYEQLQYTLDAMLQSQYTYMLSGDSRLAGKAIEDLHASLTPYGLLNCRAPSDEPAMIPVFSLYWIFMLHDYYWQTNDLLVVKRCRPAMDAILDWFDRHIGRYGLVQNLYYWEFIDWVAGWEAEPGLSNAVPRAALVGPATSTNLLYAIALNKAAELNEYTGRPACSSEYRTRAADILSRIEKLCWSDARGLYREGPEVEEYSQHAQVLAVLSGLAVGARAVGIMEKSMKDKDVFGCTYAFMYFLFQALEKAGLYRLTESLWEHWKAAEELHLTTWPEDFDRQRSDCHAWGALPLYDFTRCMLGVRPLRPGWEEILIQPVCTYITKISGCVATGKGPVHIDILNEDGHIHIRGDVPSGVPFRVLLPDGREFTYPNGGSFEVV